jgi:hypothetical protein
VPSISQSNLKHQLQQTSYPIKIAAWRNVDTNPCSLFVSQLIQLIFHNSQLIVHNATLMIGIISTDYDSYYAYEGGG